MKTRAQMTKAERIAHTVRSVEGAGCSGAKIRKERRTTFL